MNEREAKNKVDLKLLGRSIGSPSDRRDVLDIIWQAALEYARGKQEPVAWQQWNPIETAPKDNKRALYLARFNECGELVELDFNGAWEYWQESWEMAHINGYCWVSEKGIDEPTHWAYQDNVLSTVTAPAVAQEPVKAVLTKNVLMLSQLFESGKMTPNSAKGWEAAVEVYESDFYTTPQAAEVKLTDIEQYRQQMVGISTASFGYWKEGDSIHPDYDTVALRDVASLYSKYAKAAEVNAQLLEAFEQAANMLDIKADDYAKEFGFDDMGGLEFSRESQREYHSILIELAEEIRALKQEQA